MTILITYMICCLYYRACLTFISSNQTYISLLERHFEECYFEFYHLINIYHKVGLGAGIIYSSDSQSFYISYINTFTIIKFWQLKIHMDIQTDMQTDYRWTYRHTYRQTLIITYRLFLIFIRFILMILFIFLECPVRKEKQVLQK